MSCDYLALANIGVQGLHPYQPGKPIEELQRELGLTHIVKLASNENPLGLSKKVKAVISDEMVLSELTRYPDGAGFDLKAKLSQHYSLQPEQITLGNGSNDVLNLIGLSYINNHCSVVFSEHAFVVYPIMTQCLGARAISVPAKNYGHDLEAMLAAIDSDTSVVFIANPNNPTGTWLSHSAVTEFMHNVPSHVMVVLDEAYSEYIAEADTGVSYADGLVLVKQFPNLILTRTFSKAFGLAGLRVGFSVASEEVADVLNRVREPFNVNSLAQLAAAAVLDDSEYLAEGVRVNNAGRAQLETAFDALGFSFIPSQGNFISFDVSAINGLDGIAVYQALLERGVIVRPITPYGLPQHLRVSIGLEHENQSFIDAITAIQLEQKNA